MFDEYRVVDEPLTLTDAAAIADRIRRRPRRRGRRAFPDAPIGIERNELERIVARATSVRTSVDRNLAPVDADRGGRRLDRARRGRQCCVARDRRRELRLLAVRGLPPWRIGLPRGAATRQP